MVSFQCDACQDVVKKPKLDSHSYRCYASFTCVDCSKTFTTPAEWKGHTSCISEAEKYQKGLYKGKKIQQNGSSGPRGDKSLKSVKEVTSKSSTSETAPVPIDTMKDKPSGKTEAEAAVRKVEGTSMYLISSAAQSPYTHSYTAGNSGTSTVDVGTTETEQRKEGKKRRKQERKAVEAQDPSTNDPPTHEESKKKKKQKLDASASEGKTKADGISEGIAVTEDPPSSATVTTAPDSLDTNSKKEKKRKEKKTKEKVVEGADRGATGAPPAADSQPSPSNHTKKDDEAMKRKDKDLNPDVPVNEPSVTPIKDVDDDAPAKKKKKDKSRKERKSDLVSSLEKKVLGSDAGVSNKKRKQPDNEGDEGVVAGSTKKAKKRKEKKKKAESAVGPEAIVPVIT